MKTQIIHRLPHLALVQATIATAGSLFFSDVMRFPPCKLCWYQRIFMYPLVVLLAVGIIKRDKQMGNYILPLSISGTLIALYHNLLYYGIIPQRAAAQCAIGESCTTRFFAWFGFVTIPLLSLIAFAVITICMGMYQRLVVQINQIGGTAVINEVQKAKQKRLLASRRVGKRVGKRVQRTRIAPNKNI